MFWTCKTHLTNAKIDHCYNNHQNNYSGFLMNKVIVCLCTLTEQHIFRQVPQGRLHYIKVAASQAVHESWQEFSSHTRVSKDNGECICTWHFDLIYITYFPGGISPGDVLDASQGQTERHVAAHFLGGTHQPLKIILIIHDKLFVLVKSCKFFFFHSGISCAIVQCTYNKILNDFWISFRFFIHFSQTLKDI